MCLCTVIISTRTHTHTHTTHVPFSSCVVHRRFFSLNQNTGQLVYQSREKEEEPKSFVDDLRLCTVKPAPSEPVDRQFCFELVTPTKLVVCVCVCACVCVCMFVALLCLTMRPSPFLCPWLLHLLLPQEPHLAGRVAGGERRVDHFHSGGRLFNLSFVCVCVCV